MLNKVLFLLLLAGCSASVTPIEEVTTPAIKTVEEAIDYAKKGNIEETDDTRFMMAHLEACHGALVSCETVGKQSLELKDREIKSRELLIIIAAVLSFIFGRTFKA